MTTYQLQQISTLTGLTTPDVLTLTNQLDRPDDYDPAAEAWTEQGLAVLLAHAADTGVIRDGAVVGWHVLWGNRETAVADAAAGIETAREWLSADEEITVSEEDTDLTIVSASDGSMVYVRRIGS